MLKGYELGAEDYVTKPFPMSVFQKKLSVVLGRLAKQSGGGDNYEDGALSINFSEMTASLSGKPLVFTPLEYRLLKIMTKNPQNVLTRQVLLEKLWDADGNFVDEHALTAAISRVRNKIETDGHQYIKTVYGMGYMWTVSYTHLDAMFLLHLRCGQAVFSHESALFFHDLTEREPSPYAITVRRGYSTTRLKAEGLSVYTIKPELYEVGLTTGQTPFGHTVPVYDMERTICDLLRSRSSMEIQTFQGALKMYARRKDKDLRTLLRYAGMFRVEKILRQYLEVLL